jgi:serine protease AprX
VDFIHEALLSKYRGVKEWGFEHDYNWFDGVRSEEFRGCQRPRNCDSPQPIDLEGHGTHTIGTAIGSSPYEMIGMSPESQWIACRFYSGYWNANTIIRCLQFFLAPTNVRGENPNPDLRPDVSVHSYGCITPSLCPDGTSMKQATKALRTAGHFTTVAAHNYGPACKTLRFEPGTHEHVFTCGATGQQTHTIAHFSGRGPVPGIKNVKPDVTGPGENIYSSMPGNKYDYMSGTSMATPGVAGVVALLWSAVPQLKNNVDLTEAILKKTAYGQETDECTDDGIYQSPNPVYGYGSIDALRAYDAAMKLFKKK